MKLRSFLAVLLVVVLCLTGCQTSSKIVIDSDGSFSSQVFDTSKDAGKLTARYLALRAVNNTPEDKVNAGDCAVYTSPEGLTMMVDCSNLNSFDEIDAQLKMMGVDHIDIFVMSHTHADHIGCFVELAQHYPIGQLYKNAHEYTSGTYKGAIAFAKESNIPCKDLYDGDSFMFGEEVQVFIYNPTNELIEKAPNSVGEANNASIAMKLVYKDSSFWTSGDLYQVGEEDVVARYGNSIDSDIMKMNHHGYDTSNGNALIEAISPTVAVGMHESITSSNIARKYSLKYGVLTFYNCQDGAVRVSSIGDGTYDVQCQLIREKTNLYGEPALDGHYVVQ